VSEYRAQCEAGLDRAAARRPEFRANESRRRSRGPIGQSGFQPIDAISQPRLATGARDRAWPGDVEEWVRVA
jgi:hypothetical protein